MNMRCIYSHVVRMLIGLVVLLYSDALQGQTYESIVDNGSWTSASSWDESSAPSLTGSTGKMSDSVSISVGDTITLSSNLELQANSVLLVYGYLDLSGDVVFKNGCYVKIFAGGTLKSANGIQANNSSDIYVDGTLICDGDYNAGTGSSISGAGAFEVTGTLTNDGTIMGSTDGCSECNIEVGAVSESSAIVDGNTEMDVLTDCFYNYSYSQQIYTSAEMGASTNISKIYFEWDGSTTDTESWTIYMGNTSKSSFSSTSDWVALGDMTQVFSGSVSYPSSEGWVEIVLDNEFSYNSSNNLVIAVDENTSGYQSSSSGWKCSSVSTNRSLIYRSDGTNPNPSSPPSATANQKYIPSFKIFAKTYTAPYIGYTESFGYFTSCNSQASAEQSFTISTNGLTADLSVAAPTGYEISTTSGSGYSSSLTLTPSGGIVSQTVYVRMKASTASSDVIGSITLSSSGAQTRYVTCNGILNGATYYVSTTGNNSNDGLTSSTAFATIAHAISQVSSSCDKVYILNGTYDESNMDLTSTITIEGESESGVIIDNNDVSGEYCFKVTATNVDVTLKNLTIRDFKSGAGAALYTYERDNQIKFENVTVNSCYVNSTTYDGVVLIFHDAGATSSDSVVFRNCTFSDNTSAGNSYGAAITVRSYSYDYDYPVLIENSTFDNNDGSSYSEGAVSISRGYSVEVRNSVFKNNTGHYYGSGLKIHRTGSSSGSSNRVTVENCLFHDNSCGFAGAALTLEYTNGSVTNCTFAQNSNTNSSDYYVSNLDISSSTIAVKNCIFQSDDSGNEMISGGNISYSLINGGSGGDSYTDGGNNITSSPSFTDASGNDFTLDASSPAIDAGTSTGAPSTDILGTTRSTPDMGCYEYVAPQWTGGAGTTDWNTAGNWSTGVVPGSSNNIVIPSTVTDPVITGAVSAANLDIQSGGELTVSGSGSLALSGDVTISGTMNYTSTGSITLSKSGGTLSGTGSQTGADYVLSSGASFDLSDSWSIDNMNVNSGASLTVATTKTLTTGTDLTNGGTLTCSGSAGLTVGGDVSLTGSTTLGSGTFDVDGNYSNTGTFTSGTSTFKLSGSSAQTIKNTNVSVSYGGGTTRDTIMTEEFENWTSSVPDGGWANSNTSFCYKNTNNYYGISPTQYSGATNSCVRFNSYWTSSGGTAYLTSPTYDLSAYSAACSLSFYHLNTSGSDKIYLEFYDGTSWNAIATYTTSGSWTKKEVEVTSTYYNASFQFRFKGVSDYGASDMGLDLVVLSGEQTSGSSLTLSNEFYNVEIANTSGGVDLSTTEFGYSNNLTLTNGVVTTGADDTFFVESSTAGAMPAGSSTSFINGNIKFNIASNTDIYTIPLGTGTTSSDYYRVDFVNNSLTGTDYIVARMVSGSPSGYNATTLSACDDSSTQSGITAFKLKEFPSDGYLKLTPNAQPSGGDYGLNLYIGNYTKTTWIDNKVAIFKRSEGSSDNCAWDVAGTLPADGATGRKKTDDYLSFTGATSFSEIGPGGEGGGGLPVSLSAFNALLNSEGKVDITWTTMSEQDNDFFSVQRTADGENYEEVEEVPGAGNSIVRIDYSVIDEEPLLGTSYYRLMQQDYDGAQTYSDIVAVNNNFIANLTSFSLFYEGNQTINLLYSVGAATQYKVRVYDISGKIIYSDVLSLDEGSSNTRINIAHLAKGLYYVHLVNDTELYSQKIVVH